MSTEGKFKLRHYRLGRFARNDHFEKLASSFEAWRLCKNLKSGASFSTGGTEDKIALAAP